MEKDDEVKGNDNSYDFGARMYDPRVGRWLSVDPQEAKYTDLSPYNFVANSPLMFIDPDGERIKMPLKTRANKSLRKAYLTYISSEEGKATLRDVASSRQAKKYWGDKSGAGSLSKSVNVRLKEASSDFYADGITETRYKIDGNWIFTERFDNSECPINR